jgi:1,4-alpha-glucan branching enzyme
VERQRYLDYHEERILGDRSVSTFALGHLYYGLHRTKRDWVLREWAPNAGQIYLICQATNWRDDPAYRLERLPGSNGDWEIKLPLDALHHLDHYRLHIHWLGGSGDRLPSYANYVVQDPSTKQFDAVVWQPEKPFAWRHRVELPVPDEALIYEAHIGMAGDREAVSTYRQFERDVLPRVKDLGYNTVQLMAIAEHPYYGSFGYQVSNFFAPSSRFGTPGELKHLIDRAHQLGIRVIMDLIHSHAVKNEAEGLSNFDGTTTQYFVDEIHPAWDSRLFDYGKPQVCHFLLSNISYWLNEYHLDGFRFDGVTSMIYRDHGLGRAFTGYDDYFGDNINQDALVYLRLANELVHTIKPNATTIAEDTSGLPGLAAKVVDGGIGFDYRFNMGVPDLWIKMLKDQQDEEWDMGKLFHELTSHRAEERTINYVESHDQAMVGDKTVIFRLLDDTMYDSMERSSQSLVVDRGIALHKMIRLITASTNAGGYLNFMGNEFGHPEWIDFPRPGNEWSYRYARRQWHLVDDLRLRYSQLNDFDRAMIREIKGLVGADYSHIQVDSERQLISFARGGRLFVFNFSSVSLTDWRVAAPKKDWQIVLSTDDPSYGGFGRVDTSMIYLGNGNGRDSYVQLYLPARVALVLEPKYRDLAASPWR